jgi:hypothetical protein
MNGPARNHWFAFAFLFLASCIGGGPSLGPPAPSGGGGKDAFVACTCGNGVCEAECGETLAGCPCDCRVAGDGACSPCEGPRVALTDCCGTCGDGLCMGFDCGESVAVCPADCGAKCGNGTCEKGENPTGCPADCKWQVCGNGVCEPSDGGASACPGDCGPDCGDCTCGGGEGWLDCPIDCGFCGDHVCSTCPLLLETADRCAKDCGACPGIVGTWTATLVREVGFQASCVKDSLLTQTVTLVIAASGQGSYTVATKTTNNPNAQTGTCSDFSRPAVPLSYDEQTGRLFMQETGTTTCNGQPVELSWGSELVLDDACRRLVGMAWEEPADPCHPEAGMTHWEVEYTRNGGK